MEMSRGLKKKNHALALAKHIVMYSGHLRPTFMYSQCIKSKSGSTTKFERGIMAVFIMLYNYIISNPHK